MIQPSTTGVFLDWIDKYQKYFIHKVFKLKIFC